MNTYELAKITQPTCGSLFKSVMADWLGMACHYFFIFSQQLKVFHQNFSQTRNSFANYSQIRIYGEWQMLSASLEYTPPFNFVKYNKAYILPYKWPAQCIIQMHAWDDGA